MLDGTADHRRSNGNEFRRCDLATENAYH